MIWLQTDMGETDRIDELMHVVLDGESSLEQRADLDRLLVEDHELREKFAALQTLFKVMSQVPEVEPPAILLNAAIDRFEAKYESSPISGQLSAQSNVFLSKPPRIMRPNGPIKGFLTS